ncbi:SEC-C motif-containing protein [Trichlorobacter thiogenes]|uniref:SEC-C motif-containing protein n=1 Tax=Trichlorobacter thiogenes TaxID=115783 RepID=A0A1T4NYV1_9BACT|nr:YchJ family protein [Trichlorobacter thiogenes]SJZ84443.1 SEC-C motif-containing protein [Trichlorobacter thiogenes]
MTSCPCGSTKTYSDCCEPIIKGTQPAETAEQLMRARYSAYTKTEMDFVFNSTDPSNREGYDHEGTKAWAENSEWLGLEIIGTVRGGADDSNGEVEFIARFKENGTLREHHENALFKRKEGVWYFSDGVMVKPKPVTVTKIGRNDPCTCGSGLKYKKCCGK